MAFGGATTKLEDQVRPQLANNDHGPHCVDTDAVPFNARVTLIATTRYFADAKCGVITRYPASQYQKITRSNPVAPRTGCGEHDFASLSRTKLRLAHCTTVAQRSPIPGGHFTAKPSCSEHVPSRQAVDQCLADVAKIRRSSGSAAAECAEDPDAPSLVHANEPLQTVTHNMC